MKTKILALFIMFFAGVAASAADKATEVFTLDHQMSTNCEKKIKDNLRFEKGVSKIDVSLKENTITIAFDPSKTNSEKLIQAFNKIGFNASVYSKNKLSIQKDEENCDKSSPTCIQGENNRLHL